MKKRFKELEGMFLCHKHRRENNFRSDVQNASTDFFPSLLPLRTSVVLKYEKKKNVNM